MNKKVCSLFLLFFSWFSSGPALATDFYSHLKEHALKEFKTCEAFQFTENGYLRVAHSRQYRKKWPLKIIVHEMIPEIAERNRVGIRSTVHLFAAQASSFQTASTLLEVAKLMDRKDIDSLDRDRFLKVMNEVYLEKKRDQGIATCTNIKWGNFWPDLHAWPIYQETMDKIVSFFRKGTQKSREKTQILSKSDKEQGQRYKLTSSELKELKALGYAAAYFEKQFSFLNQDIGGFKGNPIRLYGDGQDGEFVCTDEMTTHALFIMILEKMGLLKHFELRDGRFAHRRPRIAADHYGIILFSKKDSSKHIVFDPWIRDGGHFPVIANLDEWFDQTEKENAIFSIEEQSKESVDALIGTPTQIVSDDRQVPQTRRFNFDGLGDLIIKLREQ